MHSIRAVTLLIRRHLNARVNQMILIDEANRLVADTVRGLLAKAAEGGLGRLCAGDEFGVLLVDFRESMLKAQRFEGQIGYAINAVRQAQ